MVHWRRSSLWGGSSELYAGPRHFDRAVMERALLEASCMHPSPKRSGTFAFALAAVLAGGCAVDVGDEAIDGDEGGADADAIDSARSDDPIVDRSDAELAALEVTPALDSDDSELLAATASQRWSIIIHYGTSASTADFGDGNAPDLYIKRFCGGAYRNKTGVAYNTTSPRWYSRLLDAVQSTSYVRSCYLELWDEDGNADDYGGRLYLAPYVDAIIANGWSFVSRSASFTTNDDVKVYFYIRRDPA